MEEDLSLAPISDLAIDCPGVYVAYGPDQEVLYVGQSGGILKRVAQHADKTWFTKVREWRVQRVLGGESQRLARETQLILALRPRHNRAIKLGLRADGTLYELQFLRGRGRGR
jgi:excinuclease UvrABC nuclease subunit